MPRTNVGITAVPTNGGVVPTQVSLDPTNGHEVAASGETRKLLLHVRNTAGAAKNVIIKAGVNPPSKRAALGDLTIQVPATTGERLIAIESARFAQADGKINIDIEAAATGNIAIYQIPDGV